MNVCGNINTVWNVCIVCVCGVCMCNYTQCVLYMCVMYAQYIYICNVYIKSVGDGEGTRLGVENAELCVALSPFPGCHEMGQIPLSLWASVSPSIL